MASRRVRDQERRQKKREEKHRESLEKLKATVSSQSEKLDRLEGLVYRIMYRSRFEGTVAAEHLEDERDYGSLDESDALTSITESPQTSPQLVKPRMAVRHDSIQESYKKT